MGFLQIFPSTILHDLGVCESYRYNPLQSYHQDHQDNPIGIIPLVNILLVDLAGASPAGSRRDGGRIYNLAMVIPATPIPDV